MGLWVFGLCWLLASLGRSAGASDPSAQGEGNAQRERMLAPLKAAGIDAESVAALTAALAGDDAGVQLAALTVLKEKHAVSAIPEIRRLLDSHWALVGVSACEALAGLGDPPAGWSQACARRLADPSPLVQLRAAAAFAAAGDARGWEIVHRQLLSKDPAYAQQAAALLDRFAGLKHGDGSPIAPLSEVLHVYPDADDAGQCNLVAALRTLAAPRDAGALRALLPATRSQYCRDSLAAIIKALETRGTGQKPG
jgi:HEAT repeat protein